jgi:DNA replication and repair protein RecF
MSILRLKANQFRNLQSFHIEPTLGFNVFYGHNGSGKTSLLETVYFLSLARSFRSHHINHIIHYDAPLFSVFSEVLAHDQKYALGLEKGRDGKTRMRLNGEAIQTTAQLAGLLPLQLMNPATFQLLEGGPQIRRQFLDWGVFHVEQSFFNVWKNFQKVLKQRNSALKQGLGPKQVKIWDQELVTLSEQLELLRKSYFNDLKPLFLAMVERLINIPNLIMSYQQGWDQTRNLQDVLDEGYEKDCIMGYTQQGPQRTDLQIKVNEVPATYVLSRGEQKMVVCALQIAQGLLLKNLVERNCIYLIDDLAAELDGSRRKALVQALSDLGAQVFLTGIEFEEIADIFEHQEVKLFHVEQGAIKEQK